MQLLGLFAYRIFWSAIYFGRGFTTSLPMKQRVQIHLIVVGAVLSSCTNILCVPRYVKNCCGHSCNSVFYRFPVKYSYEANVCTLLYPQPFGLLHHRVGWLYLIIHSPVVNSWCGPLWHSISLMLYYLHGNSTEQRCNSSTPSEALRFSSFTMNTQCFLASNNSL